MTTNTSSNLVVIAGGMDLEMVSIISICKDAGIEVVSKAIPWGASTAVYAEEVAAAVAADKKVVFIEPIFKNGQGEVVYEAPEGAIVIDHHNEFAGRPASILQFIELIGMEPTREQMLIGANDSGYITAMRALGASEDECFAIRQLDWQAQGISQEQIENARTAFAASEIVNGIRVVRQAHSRTAPAADWEFAGSERGRQNVLILSEDGSVNYYGDIAARLALKEAFADSYYGGNPEGDGFWGLCNNSLELQPEIEKFLTNYFA